LPNILRTIKNWCQFQHYKSGSHADKPPEWIKIYRRLLDDIEWHKLPGDEAKLLVNLWLLASENGGTLPKIDVIAFRLRIPEKQIKSMLGRLPHWIEDEPVEPSSQRLDAVYTPSSLEEEEEEEEKKNENALTREFEDAFWSAYPNKVGKPKAFQSFIRARRKHSLQTILDGLERYKRTKPPDRPWLNPTTFLYQERFLDEPAEVAAGPPRMTTTQQAAKRLLEKANGIGKPNGSDSDSEQARRLLPDSAARPGYAVGPDHGLMRGAAKTTVETDG